MPCDTRLKYRQTISQRAAEVRKVTEVLSQGLAAGRVKAKVGPQGAIAFLGLTDAERDGVTDACAYRRTVDKQALTQGHHSHDNGVTWHHGH